MDRRDQVAVLGDGRELGYAEWSADAAGVMVFDLHGGPGCRLSPCVDVDVLVDHEVRWVTVDRPGLGLSWPKPDRSVADFAADIAELADHLQVSTFHVVGWSMGGPPAAACAALFAERVRSLTLLAPAPPSLSGPGGAETMGKAFAWVLARDDPWALARMYTLLGVEARRNPTLALELFRPGLSGSELRAFARDSVACEFVDTMVEATRQGAVGLVDDMRVEMGAWGFDPAAIDVPTVLWQGDDDSFVTIEQASEWATLIPKLELRVMHDDGHLLGFDHTHEIVDTMLSLTE